MARRKRKRQKKDRRNVPPVSKTPEQSLQKTALIRQTTGEPEPAAQVNDEVSTPAVATAQPDQIVTDDASATLDKTPSPAKAKKSEAVPKIDENGKDPAKDGKPEDTETQLDKQTVTSKPVAPAPNKTKAEKVPVSKPAVDGKKGVIEAAPKKAIPVSTEAIKQLKSQVDQLQKEKEAAENQINELLEELDRSSSEMNELARLRQEHGKYRATLDELSSTKTEIQALEQRVQRLSDLLNKEQAKRDKLAQQAQNLARKEQQLIDLEARMEEMSAEWQSDRVIELEAERNALKRQVDKFEELIGSREAQIEKLQTQLKQLDTESPAILQEINDSLSEALRAKEKELQQYQTYKAQFVEKKDLLRRASELEEQNLHLLEEKVALQRELGQLQAQLSQQSAYQALLERVKLENSELKQDIEVLNESEKRRQERGARAFEAFQIIINKREYKKSFQEQIQDWPGDSAVIDLASQMATKTGFHFSSSQLRAFLASIRSARLVILKGFSGLGKTSLPILFARAIGAPCEVVPVQPSWRSKVDMLGFFNHFDQRFLPTQFTKALLKAQLPAFKNRHFFIVLDEMNLARVEYYFSDFNVKLEQTNNPAIELFDQAGVGVDLSKNQLGDYIKDGNRLQIPENITFIGTINDDETTYAISDKIYDRAQVIDFFEASEHPGHGTLPSESESEDPLKFDQYQSAWEESSLPNATTKKIDNFLAQLSQELRERFYLSLSYRPRRQMREFIRAYSMANGSKSEALDLQIISKVIPKIRYSHRTDFEENLDQFSEQLQKLWPYSGKPDKTIRRLELLKVQT